MIIPVLGGSPVVLFSESEAVHVVLLVDVGVRILASFKNELLFEVLFDHLGPPLAEDFHWIKCFPLVCDDST